MWNCGCVVGGLRASACRFARVPFGAARAPADPTINININIDRHDTCLTQHAGRTRTKIGWQKQARAS